MELTNSLRKAIADYKSGDASAFNTIYNESNKYIYVCINNVVCGNDNKEDMIQDIMQDTYVEISKHITSLEDDERFLSWAGTIATRKCYEVIKKNDKYVYLSEDENFDNLADDDNIIPEEIMQNQEKQRLIRDIIKNELTEAQKLCIVGVYYNEMKQSEIAKELGIPENTVKSNLLRAKARIKDAVVELAEKKDTKLYSVAPFMLLLFGEEIKACVVPTAVTGSVATAVSASAVTTGTGATVAVSGTAAAQAVGTAVGLGIKAKIAIIATSVILGVGAIAGGVAIVKNMNPSEPTVAGQPQAETQLETAQDNFETEVESVVVKKDIIEADYPAYADSIQWLLFDKISSTEFKKDMTKYEGYISSELLNSTLSKRGTEDFNSLKVFPVFEKTGESYALKLDADKKTVYGTYSEMVASMSTDASQTYNLSYFNDKMSKDDVVQYVKESQGDTNITILSVDNENRAMKIYDSVHCCYYTCMYDIEGKIISISVAEDDKKQYKVIYEWLLNGSKDTSRYGVRDINGDAKAEIIIADLTEQKMLIYGVVNGEVKLLASRELDYFHTVLGLTVDGYVMDETYYEETIEYYQYANGKISTVTENYEQKKILDTLYGRDFQPLNSSTVELFALTHGIKEDMEKEETEKNKDWVNAYKNFLLTYDSTDLLNQTVSDRMTADTGGTVKGFFLYDVNNDGQPELMVQKVYGTRFSGTLMYAYNSEKKCVEKANGINYFANETGDILTDSLDIQNYKDMNGNGLLLYDGIQALGYRKDNGWIVSFSWEGGSYTKGIGFTLYTRLDVTTGAGAHTGYKEEYDDGKVSGSKSLTNSYSAKTMYDETISNYVPFMFRTITEDNINKYVVQDYKNSGMYTYTLDECKLFYSTENATN